MQTDWMTVPSGSTWGPLPEVNTSGRGLSPVSGSMRTVDIVNMKPGGVVNLKARSSLAPAG